MAWCAGQRFTTDAVAGDEDCAEFFRVLRMQILGEPGSPSSSSSSTEGKSVSSLEFMFLDLNKHSMQLLLQAMYYHPTSHEITKIVFHGCRIRDTTSLELLAHLFQNWTHWKHVEISCLCQGLGNEQARVLIMEIMRSKDLEYLNISSMGITDGLILWKDLLFSSNEANPISITIRSSKIDFEYTEDFLSVLPISCEKRHALENLDLSACRMDDKAMVVIASGLNTLNVNLKSLALKGNRLSPKSIPVLAQLISDHPHLKAMDLSMNTRLFCAEDPKTQQNLQKIIEVAIPKDSSASMERLVLSKTSVGENAAITMIKSLETNTVLQELDLNFCLLGEKVMEQLVISLPKMNALQQLMLHGLHFNHRNAATNPHDQRQALWNALQENTSLVLIQGLNMFLGAGRPEIAAVILEHLSERNKALHEARSILDDLHPSGKRKKPLPCVWPLCLERLGRGNWTASAVQLFLQNNASAVSEFSVRG